MRHTLIEAIASAIAARANCVKTSNVEWVDKWEDRLHMLADLLPSGSGIDSGTTIDLDASTGDRIILRVPYHHMDANGYYDGWTDYSVIVKPSFIGRLSLRVVGRDKNDIKEYLADIYSHDLRREIEQTADTVRFA